MPEYPRGTVTFLFTDIEGSTRLWQAHPDAMGAAIARHDALLRGSVEAHGGVVFKAVGDAICAAFSSAPQALRAALDAQCALLAQDGGPVGPLRVRMALHSGQVEEREGDYQGLTLNRIARLLAAGHGGQVLLSLTAYTLVRDALPVDATLCDLGEHRLKDLSHPERVFQLLHPSLPKRFPPLKSLDQRLNNLPLQPTPLVGREREAADIVTRLAAGEGRLVTLTGPGGVGKTRLAVQVAADLLEVFPDGTWFVDLAPLANPALVPAIIAGVLGVREAGGQDLATTLAAYLMDKHLLLVLDNFEQVATAAPFVAELLAAAPRLTVLATSRARLRLRGEQEVAVPPLALPDLMHLPPPKQLAQYEAVQLFIARARETKTDFTLDTANAPAVAAICHRLDGLPLAIELAAARVKLFPPEALLKRLGQRLQVLTRGAQDLPTRQQTMRDAIAWSYDLLAQAEQALFRHLAVFVGGFALEAAETVVMAASNVSIDPFDGVALLLDASLLRQAAGPGGEPRFFLLETIREYGLEQLSFSGEETAVRDAHAAHFLGLAVEAVPQLDGPEQLTWVVRLDTEHGNLRAALGWLLGRGKAEAALQLAGVLSRFWQVHGHVGEGRGWLDRALATCRAVSSSTRATALHAAGTLACLQGDYDRAEVLLEEALVLRRDLDDGGAVGASLRALGVVHAYRGNLTRGVALTEDALARFRTIGDELEMAECHKNLANFAAAADDIASARAHSEEALALFRGAGNALRVAAVLLDLGDYAFEQGAYQQATAVTEEALTLAQDAGAPLLVGFAHLTMAGVAQAEGDNARAAVAGREALARFWGQGDRFRCADGLEIIAFAATTAQPKRAARLLGAGAAMRASLGAAMPTSEHYRCGVDTVRARLNDAAFAGAWTAGETLPLDAAVTEALALADEVIRDAVRQSDDPEASPPTIAIRDQ